jgi:hypothetical protein
VKLEEMTMAAVVDYLYSKKETNMVEWGAFVQCLCFHCV